MDPILVLAALALGVPLLFALSLQFPRLRVTSALKGTLRKGVLVIVLENVGPRPAKRVRVTVERETDEGRAHVDAIELDRLDANDATTVEVRDISRDAPDETWRALRVTVRARNALPARSKLALQARAKVESQPAPPVVYAKGAVCPASPDGRHREDERAFVNDGVTERWLVCRLCRHVARLPLSPEDEARQQAARAQRHARERAAMEEEFRRRAREAGEEPRARRGPARDEGDGDRLPVEVALYILGLDEPQPTLARVDEAYKRLAREYHPDRSPGADEKTRAMLEDRMRDLNRARDRLRDILRGT